MKTRVGPCTDPSHPFSPRLSHDDCITAAALTVRLVEGLAMDLSTLSRFWNRRRSGLICTGSVGSTRLDSFVDSTKGITRTKSPPAIIIQCSCHRQGSGSQTFGRNFLHNSRKVFSTFPMKLA
ncbi:hypothetical protein PoB_002865600 [Plakobranchus ocellatus]|uniref:Uncharacterized protein n=1 Tax=Plakobranchus ocellatus TaxID=259542 RepID=A0AAV4A1V6_9GAST|nr:hypothetical protein PoB_002865600 [Plakobranchus ocellatus]